MLLFLVLSLLPSSLTQEAAPLPTNPVEENTPIGIVPLSPDERPEVTQLRQLIEVLGVREWSTRERRVCGQWSVRRRDILKHIGPDTFGMLDIATACRPKKTAVILAENYGAGWSLGFKTDQPKTSVNAFALALAVLEECAAQKPPFDRYFRPFDENEKN